MITKSWSWAFMKSWLKQKWIFLMWNNLLLLKHILRVINNQIIIHSSCLNHNTKQKILFSVFIYNSINKKHQQTLANMYSRKYLFWSICNRFKDNDITGTQYHESIYISDKLTHIGKTFCLQTSIVDDWWNLPQTRKHDTADFLCCFVTIFQKGAEPIVHPEVHHTSRHKQDRDT